MDNMNNNSIPMQTDNFLDLELENGKIITKEERKDAIKNIEKSITNFFNIRNLVEQFIELHPVYYDSSRNWWIWNFDRFSWERVDEIDILNAVEKQARVNTIDSKLKNEILEGLKQVGRIRKPKEIKKTWIQFNNKIVDIISGEILESSPKYFVTNPIPWSLHEEGFFETPVMDRLFDEWVGKENVQKLYEILAYCLIPDYPIHRIFCFIGSGMNGKSCFLNLLRKFIGHKNVCSTELDTLLNSRFEVTRLHKKLVCQMGETNFSEMSKTSILKKLSGGDLIGFEYKNKDPFEEKNYAKIIIATNNLPTTTDKTIGFYRRWLIIDFPNQFSEKKDILSEIPEEEYNSLAIKCSFILRDLLINRNFTNEGSIEERIQMYESKSDFLNEFINKFIDTQDPNSYISSYEFNKKFNSWCKENRHREMSETSIGLNLKKRGWEQERRRFDWLNDGKGGQIRCWIGVKWLE